MLPENYHQDPFPINLTLEDVASFFIENASEDKKTNIEKLYLEYIQDKKIDMKSLEQSQEYMEMLEKKFMNTYFHTGVFAFIDNAYPLLQEIEKGKTVLSEIFKDFNIDISHIYGMKPRECYTLVIPFKDDIDNAEYFAYIMTDKYNVNLFNNGEFFMNNMIEYRL